MRRILAGLLAAMLGVGLGLSAAQPASANGAGNNCNDVSGTNVRVCLYNLNQYLMVGGYWQRDYAAVGQNCVNLSNHAWHTGGSVNDATESLILTAGTIPAGTRFRVRFYNWVNCSSANGYVDFSLSGSGQYFKAAGIAPYENWIGSVQIFFEPR
ncbi:hypothetical protein [Paractinoplanes hotanensis]|uniref:Uncharacterized protein n=1 Tax=Paractinoplanes hotanensis TaxID=2906497 RepID=A0ABT0Y8Z1_9ACTN|nr:hypothetical protein [Actinoplanes hotanensis]MCM4081754.1 hypothetical protein [Actinoplanes hotanensis]